MMLPRPADLNPARCWHGGMSPEVLLAAKLAWVLLLASGFLVHAGAIGAPLFGGFDVLAPGTVWLYRVLFVVAGLALVANQATRISAAVAGACVLLAPLQSIAAWRGHEWICGAILLLAALEMPGERPWLLRIQATLALLAVVLDRTDAIQWATPATLEGWRVDRDAPSLVRVLESALPTTWMHAFATWLVPLSAIALASGLWVQRWRGRAAWLACAWYLAGYLLVGETEAGFHALAGLVALLAFMEWPRQSLAAHWPRACGWPMWLRIALDHYDFDRKTDWPFPQNPDADLDVWIDGRHLPCRHGLAALLLTFPLFHMAVLAVAVVLLLALPQPWAAVAHACLGLWFLVFFAPTTFGHPRTPSSR